MSSTVAVVDYGMGNLRSVAKAIEHVATHHRVLVTDRAADIAAADRVVMPGQGAMPDCMRELDARGLRDAVIQAAASKPGRTSSGCSGARPWLRSLARSTRKSTRWLRSG